MNYFETKVTDILSQNPVMLRHPGAAQLGGDLFSSVSNSEVDLVKRVDSMGRYTISSNNLAIPGTSSFYIPPTAAVVSQLYLTGSVTVPGTVTLAGAGWIFELINYFEVVISGSSSVQSMRITGQSFFDLIMASASSSEQRNALINEMCPLVVTASTNVVAEFSIPLYLLFSHPNRNGAFGLDVGCLRSNVVININWNSAYYAFFSASGVAIVPPSGFNYLSMQATLTEFPNGDMVKEACEQSSVIYSTPALYNQSYQVLVPSITPGNFGVGTLNNISITSFPSAMLQAMIISFSPQSWTGAASTLTYAGAQVQVPCSYFNLVYAGTTIYRFQSYTEGKLTQQLLNDETNNAAWIWGPNPSSFGTTTQLQSFSYIVPIAHSITQVMQGRRIEHTPNFQGQTMQLQFCINPSVLSRTGTSTYAPVSLPVDTYKVNVTFVCGSLLEIQSGNGSLIF